MRVKIENTSTTPLILLQALTDYAASFFPHRTGKVKIKFVTARRGYIHGVCYGSYCKIWIPSADRARQTYPHTFDQMHYFRHANHADVKPLTVYNFHDEILAVIAHELEHTTKRDKRMRRSRQEIYAWNREVEVVEAAHAGGRAMIEARIAELHREADAREAKLKDKQSPEAKREHCDKLLQKWQRKLKLAQTKIRKLKTRIKYFEKKAAANRAANS